MTAERYPSGAHVLYRGIHVDDSATVPPVVCDVRPVVVLSDSPELISVFLPAGTPTLMSRPLSRGAPKPWLPGQWELVPGVWDRWNTLLLHVPGEWRSTWVMWSPAWEFLGWYVNMEEPLRRTAWGFDNRDLQLDILVAPDRTWRWKDEDDLRRALEPGLISADKGRRLRRAAEAAFGVIRAGTWPFESAQAGWRPPEHFAPRLPGKAVLDEALRWPAGTPWDRPEAQRKS